MGNELNVAKQYPNATRVENGVAYDISGKQLGSVSGMEQDQDPFAGATAAPSPDHFAGATAAPAPNGEDPFAGAIAAPAPKPRSLQTGGMADIVPQGTQATSIGARPTGTRAAIDQKLGLPGPTEVRNWLEDVRGDVRNGTHATWVGSLLHRLGAKGTSYGTPEQLGTMMSGPVSGIPETLSGATKIGDHPIQAVNEMISGIGTTLGPVAVTQPEALPFIMNATLASHISGEVAKEMGADEDVQGLVRNVAGLYAGGKTIKKGQIDQFGAATNAHLSAQEMYDARLREAGTKKGQMEQATKGFLDARQAEADGTGSRQQTVDAQNQMSQAAADVKKSHAALTEAEEAKAATGYQLSKLHREITKPQEPQPTDKKFHGAKEDFQKAIPPAPRGPAFYDDQDFQVARGYAEDHHTKVQPIRSVKDAYEAFETIQTSMENEIKPYVEKYAKEPLATNVRMDVRDKLAGHPKVGFEEKAMEYLENYELRDPTIEEAEKIRKQLNDENRDVLNANKDRGWDVDQALSVDPAFAARYYAAESIRNGEYATFREKGVNGIEKKRQDEASIIRLRNASWRQITKGGVQVRGSGESGALRKLGAKGAMVATTAAGAATGYGVGSALGFPAIGGEIGAAAGLEVGRRIGRKILPGDFTRDQLVENSHKISGLGAPTTKITGPGAPSNPPSFGMPPRPTVAMTPEMMRHLMRENTPLHSDLATHYGHFSGNSSYGELEQRFMNDIADKQQHGVALEPSEKQLLGKINQQNDADALAAKKQAQEAAAKPEEKQPVATLPDNFEAVQQIKGLKAGMNTHSGLVHDLVHAVVADELLGDKLPSLGIRSGLHEENMTPGSISGRKGLASAAFDWTNFENEDGNIDLGKIKNHLDDIAAMYVAGGVANDLWHDIPFDKNHHLGADIDIIRKIMGKLDIPVSEQPKIIQRAGERVAEILNRPGYREVIHDHAAVREPGLDETMHFSPERVQQVAQDLKGEANVQVKGKKPAERPGERPGAVVSDSAGPAGAAKAGEAETAAKRKLAEAVGSEQQRPSGAEGKADERDPKLSGGQGGHAGGGVASEEELSRPGHFVKISRSGAPTYQGKTPDFNLGVGEAGYRVLPNGEPQLWAGQETPSTKAAVGRYAKEIYAENPKLATAAPPLEAEAEERLPKVANLHVPQERTTGVHDAAIKQGGAIPGGIQKGDPEIDLPDLALFHDPATGSTLALPVDKITPENVKAQLRKSRDMYIAAEDRAAAKNAGQTVQQHADEFNKQQGRTSIDNTDKPHNPEFAKRVADSYDQMQHTPAEPKTKAAYEQMKSDVDKQWDYATDKMGIKFEPWTKQGQPYANSKEMVDDVRNNKHLSFFRGGDIPGDHPLAEVDSKTGLTYNDKFRAVHDLFGHAAQGNQFGPKGEETAYQLHRQMFSPEAVPALTSETRGQNSWVNYGKHLRNPEGNVPFRDEPGYVPQSKRPYAEQKAGILPEEFHTADPGAKPENPKLATAVAEPKEPETISDKLIESYGTTKNPHDAAFILNDGRMVPLHGEHNTMLEAMYDKYGDISQSDAERTAFINNEKAVRTRYRSTRGGNEVVFSVPKSGVSPEQIEQIKKSVGQLRNGNVVMEVGEGQGASTKKEFARVSDVEPMLQHIGATPTVVAENPKLSAEPRMQKLVADTPWEEDKNTGYRKLVVKGKGFGNDIGELHYSGEPGDENARIRKSFIEPGYRDQGIAKEMYKSAIEDAKSRGVRIFKSDTMVSPDAQHVWDSLIREGNYPITKVYTNNFNANGGGGVEYHVDLTGAKPENPKLAVEPVHQSAPEINSGGWIMKDGQFDTLRDGELHHDAAVRLLGEGSRGADALRAGAISVHINRAPKELVFNALNDTLENRIKIGNMLLRAPEGTKYVTVGFGNDIKRQKFVDALQEYPVSDNSGYGKFQSENPKLTATVVRPKGSSVGLLDNPLKVKATGETERPSTVDVAMALSKFTKKQLPELQLGKAEPADQIKRAQSIMADEAKYQLAQNNNGAAWYTTDMKKHDQILQEMRPETENPAKLSLFKMVEAVLSSGQKPYANFKSAVKAWDYYHDRGKFPEFNPETKMSWGPRGIKAYGDAINSVNSLIKDQGEPGASKWLLGDHSVRELREYNPWVRGKADDLQPGVLILGPKRGPFAQNLHGMESAFTADMWVSRTWNRWMGTAEIASDGELASDHPRSGTERELMKTSFASAAQKLKMSTSSLQAVLWYYEQALYDAHGSPKESWNFADAAKRVSDEEFNTFKFGDTENPKLSAGPEALGQSPTSTKPTAAPKVTGLIKPGNLNLDNRPVVQNDDGSHSSEYSVSFQDDKGREVLVPTVVNGKFLTQDGKKPKSGSPEEKAMFKKAWEHYKQTGEHLGIFDTSDHADAYAQAIHNRKQELVGAEK